MSKVYYAKGTKKELYDVITSSLKTTKTKDNSVEIREGLTVKGCEILKIRNYLDIIITENGVSFSTKIPYILSKFN